MDIQREKAERLMRLARMSVPYERLGDGKYLKADLEWFAWAEAPSLVSLIPTIMRNAKRCEAWNDLDRNSRRVLEARRLQQVAMAAGQRKILRHLTTRFDEEGIPSILLKGSAFLGTLYPEDAPRSAGDIDVLVRKSDFDQACDIVAEGNVTTPGHRRRRVSAAVSIERLYVFPDMQDTLLEVHRALTNPFIFRIDEEVLFRESLPHPDFPSDAVRMLSAEDNLLHLAIHGDRHLTNTDHGMVDAHEIICQNAPNWDLLVLKARRWGASAALYLMLKTAAEVLDTPVPAHVQRALRPSRLVESIAETVYRKKKERNLRIENKAFRVAQLAGQLSVPDRKLRVLGFQGYYIGLRILDWLDFRLCNKRKR